MSTERETTRIVRSWLDEGVTALPERVLDDVLDQLPATPQRWSWWPARRFNKMNKLAFTGVAAAAVVAVALVAYNLVPKQGGFGGPIASPSPSPSALAVGTFTSHGIAGQLDARGSGESVTGTLSVSESGVRAMVTLECARTTEGGLLIIGGLVTESTFDENFPEGDRVAIIFQRGTPVKAVWWVALVADPPVNSCKALVDDVINPDEATGALEPIEGTVQLAP